jgi:hypothetical protein
VTRSPYSLLLLDTKNYFSSDMFCSLTTVNPFVPVYCSLLLVVTFSSFQHQHAPHIKISLQFVPVLVRVDASSLIRPVLLYIPVSNPLLLNFVFGVVINLNFLFISPLLVGCLCVSFSPSVFSLLLLLLLYISFQSLGHSVPFIC